MNTNNISRFISLILRHKPEVIDAKLDPDGFCKTSDLIAGIQKRYPQFDMSILEAIVADDDKQRYSFNSDRSKIRANQGHSIQVDLGLSPTCPPHILYHGTATRFLHSIQQDGLKPMSRQYVHLSSDIPTALNVGKRHGDPVVLSIYAAKMAADGYEFYLSDNHVWLTSNVPARYIASSDAT